MAEQILNDDSANVEVTPAVAADLFSMVLKAGLVPLLHGAPMTSKSSIARQYANANNLAFIDCRLSTKDTVDLTGMIQVSPLEFDENDDPKPQQAYYVPFDIFPIEGDPLPKGKVGWLLFFDEITSVSKPMEVAAYQIILDKVVGHYPLHSKCQVAAAGNDPKHGAVANNLGSAMKTRVVHIFVKQDVDSWIYNYAFKNNTDPRIIGFVRQYPQHLTEFKPEPNAITYCGSRTLDNLDKLLKQGLVIDMNALPIIAGCIGYKAAHDLIIFVTVYSQLETFQQMMADPLKDRSHLSAVHRLMITDILVTNVSNMNEVSLAIAITSKFDTEFPVLLIRGIIQNKKIPVALLQKDPQIKSLVMECSQYFRP